MKPKSNTPYQVVARRYRPQGFDHLVGQSHVARALSNAITSHRIGHAYLFTGVRGVGKTSTARIFAKALNCEKGPTPNPCNVCDACTNISVGEDVDVLEIDGASNRGIDEIRKLRQNATVRPSRSKYKVYIIDEVHMLTPDAFNALLKTLEEPPEHVKFIFCTTEGSKIPITILSRCQRFDFAGIDSVAIAQHLAEIAKNEGVTADDGVFETLSRRAAGSMRDGQSLLEQLLSFASEHITIEDVNGMLGTADDQKLFRIIEATTFGQLAVVFGEIETAASEGVDVGILVEQLMGIFRDLLVASGCGLDANAPMLYTDRNRYEDICRLAKTLGMHRILASLQILDQTHTKMRFSTQGRILLEMALVRISSLGDLQSISTLLEQLRSGEMPTVLPQTVLSPVRYEIPELNVGKPATTGVLSKAEAAVHIDFGIDKPQIAPQPQNTTNNIEAAWEATTKMLPAMTKMYAENYDSIKLDSPNSAVISMQNAISKSFCEREAKKIQEDLAKHFGNPVSIRFVLSASTEDVPKSAPAPALPSKFGLMTETAESPYVQKAEELFKGKLTDVM